MADLQNSEAAPSATGGHPVPIDRLCDVQTAIRNVAKQAGYPNEIAGSTQAFDRPCGTALYQLMDIVPADAAEEGVWSFITVILVPEIGPWRFPRKPDDRMLGRRRNVLRRLWWRAWALGPHLDYAPDSCAPLGEDESVQIMERPSLGGNRRTARALQEALWRAERSGLPVPRSELMRQLARRLRATKSHISLDAISDDQLVTMLDHITDMSIRHLIKINFASETQS
ncbi:hypothetical protein MIU77_15605 [Mycolicibacillus parakoreensis]|uniref:Uncharacterized protein n=2 Tax=Mycolicibacillus parakoreensis TaxID=1069221 RepID=A0ABY3U063_9MYCO|nr:hypothetical protein [Mycolicibacillus parakoreensis]ULN52258.1 hypothetical protein MIU77_15605 [Mycolicibacillus parakoreensis]